MKHPFNAEFTAEINALTESANTARDLLLEHPAYDYLKEDVDRTSQRLVDTLNGALLCSSIDDRRRELRLMIENERSENAAAKFRAVELLSEQRLAANGDQP